MSYAPIDRTTKQQELFNLAKLHRYIMSVGGSRSGKTFENIDIVFHRAFMIPNSQHLIIRKHRTTAEESICNQTIKDYLLATNLTDIVKYKVSELRYILPNKSEILVSGIDDEQRITKIMGTQWATIYLNEASEITFDIFDKLKSRMNISKDKKGIIQTSKGIKEIKPNPKMLVDLNPTSIRHWTYKVFIEGINPITNLPIRNFENYAYIKINPTDNLENLEEGYIDTLEDMTINNKRTFLYGEYSTNSQGLWNRGMFRYNPIIPKLKYVCIGVDPASGLYENEENNLKGDEIGIIAVGIDNDDMQYVLDDYTMKGRDSEWGQAVVNLYHKWNANKIVYESNFGGSMPETIIKYIDKNVVVEHIRSDKNKLVRADPTARRYTQGRVIHREVFELLEDECCNYTGDRNEKSPNRMDALSIASDDCQKNAKIPFLSIW